MISQVKIYFPGDLRKQVYAKVIDDVLFVIEDNVEDLVGVNIEHQINYLVEEGIISKIR